MAQGNDTFVYRCDDEKLCQSMGISCPACLRMCKDTVDVVKPHLIPYYAAMKFIYVTKNGKYKLDTEFGKKTILFVPVDKMFKTADDKVLLCSPWIEGENFAKRYDNQGHKNNELQRNLEPIETLIDVFLMTKVGIQGTSLFPVNFMIDDVTSPYVFCTDIGGNIRAFQFQDM
jgi:hypothetical protein